MFKKSLSLLLSALVMALFSGPIPDASAHAVYFVSAPSAILIDGLTGHPIFSKSPNLRRPQASTTKIMTAMVVLDHANLEDVVTIPASVEPVQPSKIYLKRGEKYLVKDLIYAILMKSANDAAEALAIHVAGSIPAFCQLMNQRSRALGATNTQFKTPNGLPAKGQYSSAYDLALIMREAERYPFIVNALHLKSVMISSLTGRQILLKSHNKMLWSEKYDVIGKTGYTKSSNYCFMGRINEKFKDVYLGLLGSKKLWADVRRLCSFPNAKALKSIKTNQRVWSHEAIAKIQTLLSAHGYDAGPANGVFGLQTLSAVEAFQRDQKLPIDGLVGGETWKLLQSFH